MSFVAESLAREILANDVLGPGEAQTVLGVEIDPASEKVPFSEAELRAARELGEMLVWRAGLCGSGALTIERMIQLQPTAFDASFLDAVGYQLRAEWGIRSEPLSGSETCEAGWYLVRKDPLPASLNLDYDGQERALAAHAQQASGARRRTATEAVYDTLLCRIGAGRPILASMWDWTTSPTLDGGLLNVGGGGNGGLQVLSYSRAVRHGALGVCPTRRAQG